MPPTPEERAEMLEFVQDAYGALQLGIDGLTDEQIDRPHTMELRSSPTFVARPHSWSAREVMLYTFHHVEEHIRYIRDLDAGRDPQDSKVLLVDELRQLMRRVTEIRNEFWDWNEERVARHRDVPLAEARQYWETMQAELEELIRTSPNVQVDRIRMPYGHYELLLYYRASLLTE